MINVLGVGALNDREALANLLDALSIAEESARVIALARDETGWILVAGKFGDLRRLCSQMGQRTFLTPS